ncbi:hypothetical protein ACUOGW_24395 [Escherichia coli]
MRQQQDEPGRFSICSRQAAVVPVIVISLDDVSYCDVLDEMDIDFMKCDSLAELLTSDKLENLLV